MINRGIINSLKRSGLTEPDDRRIIGKLIHLITNLSNFETDFDLCWTLLVSGHHPDATKRSESFEMWSLR